VIEPLSTLGMLAARAQDSGPPAPGAQAERSGSNKPQPRATGGSSRPGSSKAGSAPVAPVPDRGLEIYLDDDYPLSRDLGDMKRQPRGKDFFVVVPHPAFFAPMQQASKAAGAEVTGGQELDGFNKIFIRRFTR
jgi:hypothetical protein